MKPDRDFALEVHYSKWEFAAKFNLAGSDLQPLTLSELLAMADDEELQRWEKLSLGYTETFGAPRLLEIISQTYDSLQPEKIVCFAGAEEGIFCAMHALLDPGDHAIVAYPNYQSAESIPLSICEVSGICMHPAHDWELDLDEVRAKIRPNTKLISINFPNNPTGKIIRRDHFDELVSLCRKNGIYLFSDEVYRLLERYPVRRLPQAADVYEKALSLNVMSKSYGLAGLRIGWIATQDAAVRTKMEHLKHYLSICNSAPSEVLAMIALKARDRILERNRNLVNANLGLLSAFFNRHADLFEWNVPDGGSTGFPRYTGKDGIEAFSEKLVREAGIILLPASLFRSDLGAVPEDRFRIGYGKSYLPEGLDVFDRYLQKLNR